MQEETTEKIVTLSIQTTRLTSSVLMAAMRKYLNYADRKKQGVEQKIQRKKNEKRESNRRMKERQYAEKMRKQKAGPQGKQSMKELLNKGAKLSNIRITDKNIKSFERVARKYGVDYSLKRDSSTKPPKYLVFFKARDVDVMEAAFREYAGIELNKSKKPSIRKKLQAAKNKVIGKHKIRELIKHKNRGMDR